MEEKLVAEKLLEGVVKANLATYRELFAKTKGEETTDPYWKSALTLFASLNQKEKETFFAVLKQVSVDAVSNVVGAIDGCTDIGIKEEILLTDKRGRVISGNLQDLFLAAVERDG